MARSKRTQGQTMIYKTLNRILLYYVIFKQIKKSKNAILEIKDTTDATRPASYFVLHLEN
jgi:hypothetical protein